MRPKSIVPPRLCLHCQKSFVPRAPSKNSKYCSVKCKVDASRVHPVDKVCAHCGREFRSPKPGREKLCSVECRAAAQRHDITNCAPTFWAKVNIGESDACWPWIGFRVTRGYGFVVMGGQRFLAHRIAYELTNGAIGEGLSVCHRCDNPPCVNPRHLFLGTVADNAADMVNKGRSLKGERHNRARLTEDAVKDIRAARSSGTSVVSLAVRYNVSEGAIEGVVHRRNWKHVP